MVPPVQLLSKIILLILLITGCNHRRNAKIIVSASNLTFVNNLAQYKGVAFSGKAFKLHENNRDTLFTRNYLRGKKNGIWEKFYVSGDIKERRKYKNGKKSGKYIGYYEGEIKAFEYNFLNGEYNGRHHVWNKDGVVIRISNYKNGYELGEQKIWDENGEIVSNYIIKNGRRFGLLGKKNCVNASENIIY